VKFKDEYHNAFWYVFGDTIVVNSLDDARRLMGGVRLVDLKGNLIETSGAIRGGSKPKMSIGFTNVDRGRLDEITNKFNEAISTQDSIGSELSDLRRDIVEIEGNLTKFKTEGDKNNQIRDLVIREKEFNKKLENLNEDLKLKLSDKEELVTKKNDLEKKIEEIQQRLNELDKVKDEKGKILLKGTKKEQAQIARSLEDEVKEYNEIILTFNSEIKTIDKKIEILNERKQEILDKIQSKEKEIENYKVSIKELKEKRSSYHDELKALMNVEEQMTGKMKDLTKKRDEIYKGAVTLENDIDKINTRVESYYDLVSRAKYRIPTLQGAISELDEELRLYNVEITDTKIPNVESLKESMKITEESMRELEPVNMRALEEYEHQYGRKNKLDEDVKHLKNQRKNLLKLVKEINDKKKERFFEVFEEINKNFRNIYGQLSEGGEAELKLENEEILFENGLTIKAKPRGKKVLLLSALSGGEKSIASLAFIFAIQNYDPSPFYVLDEVDMFLDGVNAETVSRMVKSNSLDSQFIMVTLRKIALKEANHIYGVTMKDDGISDMIGNIDPESVGPKGELKTAG
jgi:chromosome segregation protein